MCIFQLHKVVSSQEMRKPAQKYRLCCLLLLDAAVVSLNSRLLVFIWPCLHGRFLPRWLTVKCMFLHTSCSPCQCVPSSNFVKYCAGLEVWINSFIKDIGLKPFVLPEGLTVPLTTGRVDGLVVNTPSCQLRVLLIGPSHGRYVPKGLQATWVFFTHKPNDSCGLVIAQCLHKQTDFSA